MKLSIIENALANYIRSAECSATDVEDVLTAIQECAATRERYERDDLVTWKEDVQLVPLSALIDLLNMTTYDVYGKRARIHGANFTPAYYKYDCRKQVMGCEMLTDSQLESGYEVINDLWQDNEADGCHNEDGTFKK